jgi:hypothetical protein
MWLDWPMKNKQSFFSRNEMTEIHMEQLILQKNPNFILLSFIDFTFYLKPLNISA